MQDKSLYKIATLLRDTKSERSKDTDLDTNIRTWRKNLVQKRKGFVPPTLKCLRVGRGAVRDLAALGLGTDSEHEKSESRMVE